MIPYFKSAHQTLTLRCPGVVVAVGWLEGGHTIPPSSPGPKQESREWEYVGICSR